MQMAMDGCGYLKHNCNPVQLFLFTKRARMIENELRACNPFKPNMPFRCPPTKKAGSQYVALSVLEIVLVIAIMGGILGLGWASLRVWGHHSALKTARQELVSYVQLARERASLSNLEDRFISVALQVKDNEPVHVRMFEENPASHEWHMLDNGWAMPARIRLEGEPEHAVNRVQIVTAHGVSKTLEGTWYIIEFDRHGALRDGKTYTLSLSDDMNRVSIAISPSGHVTEY